MVSFIRNLGSSARGAVQMDDVLNHIHFTDREASVSEGIDTIRIGIVNTAAIF